MAPFIVPRSSLSHLYPQACSEFTWEKVRTAIGVKVKPKTRKQTGRTCIYEAVCAWLESHLRLHGIVVTLSMDDLREKEQNLTIDEMDRTVRCIIVIKHIGVCSEDDYKTKNLYGNIYRAAGTRAYFKLHDEAIKGALESMHKGPLLVTFHCGENYLEYVFKYNEVPVLSYERYAESVMIVHAVNALGYGVENIVPWWRYMNSYGKSGCRELGRVLPQNCIYVYGMNGVVVERRECLVERRRCRKRARADDEASIDEEETYARPPPLKKMRLEMAHLMEVDDDLMEIDLAP